MEELSAGDIGGITIQGDKIGDAGGSWYISKSSVYLPNLKVTSGGAVEYNVGTSGSGTNGISGNRTHIGGSAGSSYIQPGTVRSSTGGPTLQQTIKEWICEAIGTCRLTIYEDISNVGGKYVPKGKKVIVMNGGSAEFNAPLKALEGLQLFSSNKLIAGGFEGQSKVVHFNNNTCLSFTCGICTGGQDFKGNTFGR